MQSRTELSAAMNGPMKFTRSFPAKESAREKEPPSTVRRSVFTRHTYCRNAATTTQNRNAQHMKGSTWAFSMAKVGVSATRGLLASPLKMAK